MKIIKQIKDAILWGRIIQFVNKGNDALALDGIKKLNWKVFNTNFDVSWGYINNEMDDTSANYILEQIKASLVKKGVKVRKDIGKASCV
jgi:hypothetical protein